MRINARQLWVLVAWTAVLLAPCLGPPAMRITAFAGEEYCDCTLTIEPDIICVGCRAKVTVTLPSGEQGGSWVGSIGADPCFVDGGGASCELGPCGQPYDCPYSCDILKYRYAVGARWSPNAYCHQYWPNWCGPKCRMLGGSSGTSLEYWVQGRNSSTQLVKASGAFILDSETDNPCYQYDYHPAFLCTGYLDVAQVQIATSGLDAVTQHQSPGAYMGVNDDFDEQDVVEDRDTPSPVNGGTVWWDDLRRVWISLSPGYDLFYSRVDVTLSSDTYIDSGGAAKPKLRIHAEPRSGLSWHEITPGEDLADTYFPYGAPYNGRWLYVEGLVPGEATLTITMTVPGGSMTCTDYLRFTVVQIDADVDSDNDGTLQRSQTEDNLEISDSQPGAVVVLNNDDDDADHFIDWADGFDGVGSKPEDDVNSAEDDFVEMRITISNEVDVSVAHLQIQYPASDPAQCVVGGAPAITTRPAAPAQSGPAIRVWKKPGSAARDKRAVNDGGDWITPGQYIDLRKLSADGLSLSHEFTFYIEGVSSGASGGTSEAAQVRIDLDPDGDGASAGWLCYDLIKIAVIAVDLDVDTNRDVAITDDEIDDMGENVWSRQRGAIALLNCDDDNMETGVATQITATSLTIDSGRWFPDQWKGGWVSISANEEGGFSAGIIGNTGDTLSLSPWSPRPPVASRTYRLHDDEDRRTPWVDGLNDKEDMLRLVIRPMGLLPSGWRVLLKTPDSYYMNVWADEDANGNRQLDITPNEDFNGSGYLDTEEDTNGNGRLDPGEDLNGNQRLDNVGAVAIRHGVANERDITALAQNGATLYLEALDFPTYGDAPMEFTVQLELLRQDGSLVACDEIRAHVAPWLMIPPTRSALAVLAVRAESQGLDNEAFLQQLETQVAPVSVKRINGAAYGNDVWIQDAVEIGYTDAPHKSFHVAFISPRTVAQPGYDDLRHFGKRELLGPDFGIYTLNTTGPSGLTTQSFGNLEVSPPVTVGGVSYPFGRVLYGIGKSTDNRIVDFLSFQDAIQAHIEINTQYLEVQHVDEIFSLLPGSGTQGFRVAVASPQRAIDILTQMALDGFGNKPLAAPPGSPALQTVSWLLDPGAPDNISSAYNQQIENQINASLMTLETGLGLGSAHSDCLWIPVWFGDNGAVVPTALRAFAYSADMVNGLLASPGAYIAPNPHGPVAIGNRFTADMYQSFSGVGFSAPTYVDDWIWYHLHTGEVHCGTNTIREIPAEHWWSTP